jgi:ABC-type transport system substrate-binding protein
MLLASGMSPVYPCHVTPRDMRTHPIGTGPFKFAEFKPNEYIRVVKNPDYWKPGRPYLDAVEWTIIPNRSTQTLAFIAGKFDMSFPYEVTLQSVRDIQKQAPNAICEMTPTPVAMNLLVNRDAAPFNDPDIRRAMQLTIDRKSFLDIIAEGQGDIKRRDAVAARRPVGAAARDTRDTTRLWAQCRGQPRRGAQADAEARLRPRPPARRQGRDAQHCAIPRPGHHPD